jgi:nitrogen fixation protein NifX
MKIAFASTDSIHVNQHFGWCEKFYIYDVDGDGYKFIKDVDSSQKHDDEIDKLEYKIECLDNSDIVYTSQIGPKAANMVKLAGVFPMKATSEDEKIDEILSSMQKMINGNPPLWMKRILMKSTS